jgi:hypothetical protein
MARLFIDGFETGNYDCWDINSAAANPSTSPVRSGTGSYSANPQGAYIGYVGKNISPSNANTLYFKFYYYLPSNNGSDVICWVANGSGAQLALCYNSNRTLSVKFTDKNGTTIATGTKTLTASTWYLVEGYFVINAATGVIQTKINGIVDINFSGNTHNQSADTITQFYLGTTNGDPYNPHPVYDDLVLDDAGWIGDGAILPLVPDGAGSMTQLTPSSGANYTCINSIPTSDANNVSTNTPGNEDTYVKAAISTSVVVNCVQMFARAEGQGNPACGGLEHVLRIGGTDYVGSRLAVPTGGFGNLLTLFKTSPATGVAFTPTEVNGMEIGARLVA